ncbi:MAG: signal peptidase I, partial [Nanoarchaeota archaeon]
FIIVKFIFFPALSLLLSTPLPLVVVESSSMHHPGSFVGNVIGLQDNFEAWWQEEGSWYEGVGIAEEETEKWPLKTGLEIGDIVLVSGYGSREVGDIIIFEAEQKYPVIHRVVEIVEENNSLYYKTKGDNNPGQLSLDKNISNSRVIGKAVLRIPKLGWIKLAFVKLLGTF